MREKQNFLKKKVIYIYFYIKPVIFWFFQKKNFGLFG